MKFFRTFLACLLAVIVSMGVLMIIFFSFIVGIVATAGKSTDTVTIADHSVLHLTFTQTIVENAEANPFDEALNELLPNSLRSTSRVGLFQMLDAIEYAKSDDRIEGIYLDFPVFSFAQWANLKSIRDALQDFKTSGKFVYAYADIFQEDTYYLASVADSIFMPKIGTFELNGLSSSPFFVKNLLDELGVDPQIFRVGEYKSAVEIFERTDMSEPSRRQLQELMDTFWQNFVQDVSISRGIHADKLNELASDFITGDGKKAMNAGLIDQLTYKDPMRKKLLREVGENEKKLNLVSLPKYIPAAKLSREGESIAVVFAEGNINLGKSSDGVVGSETIIRAMRKARENNQVKAVVLRVNSPGGSALASDLMKDAIERTRKVKPVIVSMGDYAASGGYYIAAPASKIYAQPTTITGSIGVFGVFFQTQDLFTDKLGVTFDRVQTHPYAGYLNPNFPIGAKEKRIVQQGVEQTYETFLEVVNEGRGFEDVEKVRAVAAGRVWSGEDAKDKGLVDELGDLRDALEGAAKLAGMDSYNVMLLPKPKSAFEALLGDMNEINLQKLLEGHEAANVIRDVSALRKTIPESGQYMLMPQTYHID